MMKLVAVAMGLLGFGLGVGAAAITAPSKSDPTPEHAESDVQSKEMDLQTNFIRFERQFVVPIVKKGRVQAMVVMAISLEVAPEAEDRAFARLPRLRDSFLRVMLDHSSVGRFDGAFTENGTMDQLRVNLLEAGRAELGGDLKDILILDVGRQEA